MTPQQQILQHTYTFEEGAPEPHKGEPCAGLDLAATKQAIDWHNIHKASIAQKLTKLSPERLAEYWVERWYVGERTHCLLKRIQELWRDIPESERPVGALTKQKYYKGCDNARNHALVSFRSILGTYGNTKPPGIHMSTETEEYRKAFKKWLISRRCTTPKIKVSATVGTCSQISLYSPG